MYWAGRVVKYKGKGVPDRAYAKWYALHKLWQVIGPVLGIKTRPICFREKCERNKWFQSPDEVADQIYRSLVEFYKTNRGKGAEAIDISNFFYRPINTLRSKNTGTVLRIDIAGGK